MMYEYFLLNEPSFPTPSSVEETFRKAYELNQISSTVLVANGPDNYYYAKSIGSDLSFQKGQPSGDPILCFAECSQLLTVIACMQCVERGLINLDADISKVLPEFRAIDSSSSFRGAGKQHVLDKDPVPITLRHLLTHSSGFQPSSSSPSGIVTNQRQANDLASHVPSSLAFTPGTSCEYTPWNFFWANVVISRITSSSPHHYIQRHIFNRLSMRDSTFGLKDRPDLRARLVTMHRKLGLVHPTYDTSLSPNGEILPDSEAELLAAEAVQTATSPYIPNFEGQQDAEVLYCSATDFAKVLHSLSSNDGKLLRPGTVDQMFQRQFSPATAARLTQHLSIPEIAATIGVQPRVDDTLFDCGLGGLLVIDRMTNRKIMRGAATPNIYWWMDLEAGISGVWASQLLPKGDRNCVALAGQFIQSVYEALRG